MDKEGSVPDPDYSGELGVSPDRTTGKAEFLGLGLCNLLPVSKVLQSPYTPPQSRLAQLSRNLLALGSPGLPLQTGGDSILQQGQGEWQGRPGKPRWCRASSCPCWIWLFSTLRPVCKEIPCHWRIEFGNVAKLPRRNEMASFSGYCWAS